MKLEEILETLFHHDTLARQAESDLLEINDRRALKAVLTSATDKALEQSDSASEVRLEVLAGLWGHIGDDRAATTLMGLLSNQCDAVRRAACEALIELAEPSDDIETEEAGEAFECFARVVRNTLKGKERFGPEIDQLAYVLTALDNEKVVDLLLAMLNHQVPRAVAAGLAIAGEWAWDDGIKAAIEKLTGDSRSFTLVDEDEGEVSLSLAELASEIEAALRALK